MNRRDDDEQHIRDLEAARDVLIWALIMAVILGGSLIVARVL